MKVAFYYDVTKNQANLEKHGIDFEETKKLWDGTHLIIPAKNIAGENRFAILGRIRSKVYMAIYTERKSTIRIISCHRADKKWENLFYEHLKKNQKKEDHHR